MDQPMGDRLEKIMREYGLTATPAAVLVLVEEVKALRDQLEEVTEGIGNIR